MAEDEGKTAEDSTEEGATTEAAPKRSLRLFILLTIVNLGFLSWLVYTMKFQVEAPRTDEIESVSEEAPEEEAFEALSNAIPMEPFLVNVVARHKGKARHGQKVLRVRFEVVPESDEAIKSLEKYMPKLRDSINMLLSSQDYGDLAMSRGREALRRLIKEQINEVIQPARIKKVYFTEFVIN